MEKLSGMYEPRPASPDKAISKVERVREYIRSFEEPAENLLRQLEANIEAGIYSHILGIDASGRIPALIVGEYISKVSKKNGLVVPKRLFAGTRYTDSSSPQLIELFSHAASFVQDGKRVLVVDDTIYKGNSLKEATTELRRHGIPFDAAVFLAVNSASETIQLQRDYLNAENLYVGDYAHFSDGFDENDTLAPIVKNKSLLGVVREYDFRFPDEISDRSIPDPEDLVESRTEIGNMVNDLIVKITKPERQETL